MDRFQKVEINRSNENKPSLDNLFVDFDHPNPNINQQAYLNMARYWPKAAIERLVKNLNHKDIVIRRKSVKALGCFGDIALSPVAKIFLNSQDSIVRISCLKIFVKIASIENYESIPKSLEEVIDLSLKDEDPQIILALVSLLRQLDEQGLPILILISSDENILRAKAAITALGEMNNPSAVKCLKSLLNDTSIDKLLWESVQYSLGNYVDKLDYKP